ncbi:hypothetical protein XENOCAPTIV_016869, partial [Xenoophorus captivus]
WCPPCRALLPELRKASIQLAGQMRFGTLDCTIHHDLCSTYNIQAYPTTVVFNGSSVHEYEGHHSADGILEFIQVIYKGSDLTEFLLGSVLFSGFVKVICFLLLQDLVNPSVVVLDAASFKEKVKGTNFKLI